MKLKYLTITSLSLVTLPAISLISCSSGSLTGQQITEQTFLVSEAAKKQMAPEITLKQNTNINDVQDNIVKVEKLNDKNLLFEIINFEIPLIGSIDNNVHMKVSSKLDKEIYETYSFKISSAIVPNSFQIEQMTKEDFDIRVKETYFKDQFLSEIINDISLRVKQSSNDLDITKKIMSNGIPISIFDIPESKTTFQTKFQNLVSPIVLNKMNEVALQKGMKIEIKDIQLGKEPSRIEGLVNMDIVFGSNSIYSLEKFPISTFSTEYADLEKQLSTLLQENIKPTLFVGENVPIKISELYKNLSIFIPDDLGANENFGIGIDTSVVIPPNSNENFEIIIEIYSKKYSNSIYGNYKVKINQITNYSPGIIDFIRSNNSLLQEEKNSRRSKTWL